MATTKQPPPVSRRRTTNRDDWGVRLTRDISTQVHHWRRYRGLSTAELSEATAIVGYRVPRTVLINLENDRREHIAIAEILAIAAALNISPMLLIAPVATAAEHEVLPALNISPWLTRDWFIGRRHPDYPAFNEGQWRNAATPVAALETHDALIRDYISTLGRLDQIPETVTPTGPDTPGMDQVVRDSLATIRTSHQRTLVNHLLHTLDELRRHRSNMRALGLVVPELPDELAGMGEYEDPSSATR